MSPDSALSPSIVRAAQIIRGFDKDDQPRIEADAAVVVQGGMIQAIGPAAEMAARYPGAAMHGGDGFVITPGFVNAHHHVGLTPLQLGSADHPLELWFASRLALRDVDLTLDTLYSAFEMIASGVTTVQHLHSRAPGTPRDIVAAAEKVISAYRAIGMRATYSMALRDQNRLVYEDDADFVARLPDDLKPAMRDYFTRFTVPLADQIAVSEELLRRYADDPLIRVQVAPSNLHWLSENALEAAGDLARRHGVPLHMHLLETPYQKAYARRRTGGSAVRHLERLGLLGPQMTLGHGVWMTEDDIALCAQSGTRICHNCSSNFRLKSGVAPVNRFLAEGVPVAIGIDEAGVNDDRDMLQEMRMVLRTHREPGIDAPHPSPATVMRMATEHGAGTTPFAGSIGRLEPGMAADLVLFDWKAVTYPYQSADLGLVETLVQRAKSGAVHSVIIGGDFVYQDRRFTRVNRDAALAEIAARLAAPLTPAEEARRVLAREAMPHVRRFYDGYLDGLGDEPHYRTSGRF
ncbi:N-ethylammeline chlorohydrolase [Alsobacter metallidurans]|uniref:N-ethylammeline chlorohydrolase n=1 Tax=Alsobacter metallidurans TaxID=340221 RepID=A0A917I5W2_9HYPH|nr:amidohydrolase family protein [Alsobacter metallidurans]GGH17843.1 N-ethylammeline chlorohydrolase [Alsobacter metallidurans]